MVTKIYVLILTLMMSSLLGCANNVPSVSQSQTNLDVFNISRQGFSMDISTAPSVDGLVFWVVYNITAPIVSDTDFTTIIESKAGENKVIERGIDSIHPNITKLIFVNMSPYIETLGELEYMLYVLVQEDPTIYTKIVRQKVTFPN